MDTIILEELEEKIALAIKKGLIPPTNKEVEFTMNRAGMASCIEIWSCSNRRDSDRTVVAIPDEMQSEFVFSKTAKHLKNITT